MLLNVCNPKRLCTESCVLSRLLVTSSFVLFVITFEPNDVQTCSQPACTAPQNDRLNLVFVKDIKVVVKKKKKKKS